MKQYHYFVSFSSNSGFGMCEYHTDELISSFEDIWRMQQCIAQKTHRSDSEIVIIQYQLIRNEKY